MRYVPDNAAAGPASFAGFCPDCYDEVRVVAEAGGSVSLSM